MLCFCMSVSVDGCILCLFIDVIAFSYHNVYLLLLLLSCSSFIDDFLANQKKTFVYMLFFYFNNFIDLFFLEVKGVGKRVERREKCG